MDGRWESRAVRSGEVTVAAQALGGPADPTVLLIGGATWSRDWWPDEFCARLVAAGLRVVRYDQRDTGESTSYPPGEPGYTGTDLVADALAVLDAFGVDGAYVLGLSMGGGIAQHLTALHPDRVAGLVLVATSPVGDTDLPGPTPEILRTFEDPVPDPDWTDREAVVDWTVASERPYAGPGAFDEAVMRELAGRVWDRTGSMASVANHFLVMGETEAADLSGLAGVPALVLHGFADPLFPLEHGYALARALEAPLVVLDDVGHQVPPPHTWPTVVEHIARLVFRNPGASTATGP